MGSVMASSSRGQVTPYAGGRPTESPSALRTAAPVVGKGRSVPERLVFSTVAGGSAYACVVNHETGNGMEVFVRGPAEAALAKRYRPPLAAGRAYPKYPVRWRVAGGFVWGLDVLDQISGQPGWIVQRIPIGDLAARFDADRPRVPPRPGDPWKNLAEDVRRENPYYMSLTFADAVPLNGAYTHSIISDTGPVYYDLLTFSANSCRLFVLWGPTVTVWEYRGKGQELLPGHQPRSETSIVFDWEKMDHLGEWWKVQTINAGFSESFYAFRQGSSYFFATDSGNLYETKATDGEETAAKQVALAAGHPIAALVADVDAGKTFAFTDDSYFEVAKSPRLTKIEGGPVSREGKDSAQLGLEYARVLHKAQGGK